MTASSATNTSSSEDIWFVDLGASSRMTSHQEWFWDLREPEWPSYVEIGDDTTNPIRHIDNVPSGKEGIHMYIKNILDVPTIKKNMVSLGQIVEQGMQVRFNHGGCLIDINLHKLNDMQMKGVIIGISTFTKKEIAIVCDACQFSKQHRQPFSKGRNISKRILDVIHLHVWGPT